MNNESTRGKLFEPPLSIREACMQASSFLERERVTEPREHAELLLMHLLGSERAALLRDWNEPFPAERLAEWERLLRRKAAGEPLQYIVGEQWFYGRPFKVTPAVLIPRPETELLVEAVLEEADALWPEAALATGMGAEALRPEAGARLGEPQGESGSDPLDAGMNAAPGHSEEGLPGAAEAAGSGERTIASSTPRPEGGVAGGRIFRRGASFAGTGAEAPVVLDVGTGSGAIAVTLAAERPRWRVCATDISPDALDIACRNASGLGTAERMLFTQGDLLKPYLNGEQFGGIAAGLAVDVLVSNPPYIPEGDIPHLQREVRDYEPRLALDGGADGLDPYRRMLDQLDGLARIPRIVAFELGIYQAGEVAALLKSRGHWDRIRIVSDYGGIERHVLAIRSQNETNLAKI
ncbi:N5-glutamine methyltransferase family protein [Paenibacillus thailandensis]|uniref:Release factor glutamine methyltransferase n=1 Tax=Paenibacillus thailandensis TaxID=393250 RepID=A0ABW5R3X7_9BACL